jgi:hypothetical protein
MALTPFGQMALTILGSLITASFIAFFTWFVRVWNRDQKRRNVRDMKNDSMIDALSALVPGFKDAYSRIFNQKLDEEEFINQK